MIIDPSDVKVLGISGKAGSGKDYLARTAAWKYNLLPLSLAAHFKAKLSAYDPHLADEIYGREDRSDDVRQVLQAHGHTTRLDAGEDIWCLHVEAWMSYFLDYGYNKFVIPDIRYKNEVDFVQNLGGKVIRVVGRGGLKGELGEHPSETSLTDELTIYDHVFDNSPELEASSVERFLNLVGVIL